MYNDPGAAHNAPVRIKELVFLSAGFERTDANWISSLYRPEAKTEHTDARVSRPLEQPCFTHGAMSDALQPEVKVEHTEAKASEDRPIPGNG